VDDSQLNLLFFFTDWTIMDSLTLTESCADMILWAKGDHGHPPNWCCFAVGQHPSPSNLVLLYV